MKRKFLKNESNFHFPANYSKKDALRCIKRARIEMFDTTFVCVDYEHLLEYGYVTLNRGFGFYVDYTKWL